MRAATSQGGLPQIERLERHQILPSHPGKLVQQLIQRLPLTLLLLCKPVKGIERPLFASIEKDPHPRHPVRAFSSDQVADNIDRAPGFGPLGAVRPYARQSAQQSIQARGSAAQHSYCVREMELSWVGHNFVDAGRARSIQPFDRTPVDTIFYNELS